ncbi:2-hydroxyisoflavanone dehydratase [Capsicum galapagoense]
MAEIAHDLFPLLRVYKDGRVERLLGEGHVPVPAESDPETGVQIKDVEINPESNLAARLYLPKDVNPVQKLPLFVYFHGGGFVIESASSPSYHKHISMVAAEAKVVVISVNYRLAPEYPLPIAYEDSWAALKWIIGSQEKWIKDHADFSRVYFGGDSAGGNIAHNMAIRVGSEKMDGIKLVGIFLACPFFWGKDPIDSEADSPASKFVEKLWLFVNPNSSGLDDPLINPEKDPKLCSLGCEKVFVYVAERDPLRSRGFYYKEALEKSGWQGKVEIVEIKDEGHVFHLFAPAAEKAMVILKQLASFLNQSED